MAEEYRFKKRAEGPQFEQADELVLWASDDGTLKTTDEDGTVAPVAGAGSLPEPTDEGDVLTVVDDEWVGASPGGSVPVYVQDNDPGAVGAGALWVDTTGDPVPLAFIREANDGAWSSLGAAVGAIDTESGEIKSSGGGVNTDGGDISTDGGSIDTGGGALDFGGATVELDSDHVKVTGSSPTLFDSGINAGGYPIVGLAEGVDPTDAATVSQLGGSMPGSVRLVNLETVVGADLASSGPATVFTPEAGEIVYAPFCREAVFSDVDIGIAVGNLAEMVAEYDSDGDLINTPLMLVHNDLVKASYGRAPDGSLVEADTPGVLAYHTAALTALWFSGRGPVTEAPVAWQALHEYEVGDWVIADTGWIAKCTQAGTSDATEPVWPSDGSSDIPDGTVLWAEAGLPVTTELTASVHVSIPDTP